MRSKPTTRRTVLSHRDALSPEQRAAASERIANATMDHVLDFLKPGDVVALYAPKGTEVETARIDAIARARGLRVVYPRIVDDDRRLAFHEVTIDELVPAKFGLREPLASAASVPLDQLAAVIVPGLAFDRSGGRIGWGRGYYDATLAAAPQALPVGLAYECQIIDQVPRDPHDVLIQYVVTETAIARPPRADE